MKHVLVLNGSAEIGLGQSGQPPYFEAS